MSKIKSNDKIRELLIARTEDELKITKSQIIQDALKYGVVISSASLSRYWTNQKKDKERSSLTEFQVLWLCCRYCIKVNIQIKKEEYSRAKALTNLKTCKL